MTRAQQQVFSDIRKIANSIEKLVKILENEKKIDNKD
tara:strand:+ start:113 stop:223 length:111 start_codon:yes stop_codon:yes gene_type:complete